MQLVDVAAATNRLLRFLEVPGITDEEALIGKDLVAALKQAGVPARAIRFDDAYTRIALPTQCGSKTSCIGPTRTSIAARPARR